MASFIILIHIVFFSMAMAQQPIGNQLDRWSFLVTPIQNAPLLSSTPWLLQSQPAVVIRDDYTYTPGVGAHKFHKQNLAWNEARRTCEEEGGHLAIINSIAESKAIIKVYKTSGGVDFCTWAYIGFHDIFEEGEYVTLHGQSLAKAGYTEWFKSEPTGSTSENCGVVNKDSVLGDVPCGWKIGFICELEVK